MVRFDGQLSHHGGEIMKAETYQTIEKLLIDAPVEEIIQTAVICLERKERRNSGKITRDSTGGYSPVLETQCGHAIHKLNLLLRSLDKLALPQEFKD